MSNNQLRIPFNSPLHPQDTEDSIMDAAKTTPTFAETTDCREYVRLYPMTAFVKSHLAHGRSSSKSSRNQAAKL